MWWAQKINHLVIFVSKKWKSCIRLNTKKKNEEIGWIEWKRIRSEIKIWKNDNWYVR
jgi:hypothetical protein